VLASGVTRKLVETMTMKTYRVSPFGEKNRRLFHIESLSGDTFEDVVDE
jgi:hypothetical protein